MASPDPRPGRWILPLVVVGMVLFTYVFVQAVPGADDGGDEPAPGTSSTTSPGEEPSPSSTTTIPLDPEVAAFLTAVDDHVAQLTSLHEEMTAVNAAWDADPREIEYGDAESQVANIAARTETWAESVAALTPPAALAGPHATLVTTAETAADAAADVLTGLQGPDAQPRLDALARFNQATSAVQAAADQIRTAAAAPAP